MMTDYLTYLRSVPLLGLSEREYEDHVFAEEFEAACRTCRTCGDVWHPEFEQSFTDWSSFHSGCAPHPCDGCGEPTSGPDYCFTCYHEPFGIGWQRELAGANR